MQLAGLPEEMVTDAEQQEKSKTHKYKIANGAVSSTDS
jgi:hypothetical protein